MLFCCGYSTQESKLSQNFCILIVKSVKTGKPYSQLATVLSTKVSYLNWQVFFSKDNGHFNWVKRRFVFLMFNCGPHCILWGAKQKKTLCNLYNLFNLCFGFKRWIRLPSVTKLMLFPVRQEFLAIQHNFRDCSLYILLSYIILHCAIILSAWRNVPCRLRGGCELPCLVPLNHILQLSGLWIS